MSDLAKSQAEWNRFWLELAQFLGIYREIKEIFDKYSRTRTQVINAKDAASATEQIAAITLTGIKYGVNTDAYGRLFVRTAVNGGGGFDVSLYKATGAGGGDLVAKATGVLANGTGALVEQNSSGVSGSITLGGTVVAETNDKHVLYPVKDWPARAIDVWTGVDGIEDDESSRGVFTDLCGQIAALQSQAIAAVKAALGQFLLAAPRNPKARGNAFLLAAATSIYSETVTEDPDRNVSRTRTGLVEELSSAMRDDSNAEQDVLPLVPTAGAGVFDGGNTGLGTVAGHTPDESCAPMRLVFECVEGAEDDAVGRERFRLTGAYTRAGDDRTFVVDAGPVVGRTWEGPFGLMIALLRTLTKTGDGSNLHLAAMSYASVSGESNANTSSGVLWWKVVANGSNFNFEFYKSSNMLSTDLVAKALNVAAGATFVAETQRGSGLVVTWKAGSAPVAGTTGTLLLNCFRSSNANGRPDKFTVTVTVAANGGKLQRAITELFGRGVNSDASPTISDALVQRGVLVPPFSVPDN